MTDNLILFLAFYFSGSIVFIWNNRLIYDDDFVSTKIEDWGTRPRWMKATVLTIVTVAMFVCWWWYLLQQFRNARKAKGK